jgi:hypothetical protein
VVNQTGKFVASVSVKAGDPLPPTPAKGQCYKLKRTTVAIHTSTKSSLVMDKTTRKFKRALESLAKK